MEEKVIFDENYKESYSNWVRCETSLYDIKLLFGTIEDDGSIKASTKIIMSPQHTKALLNMLKGTIEGYEKNFGEINIGIKNE